ncbi:hypothetical protein BU24DRAFT_421485 [Aaosphaeria arxii CBS 175.79]|uniref:Uncharacterized protein n=1 Tax=Aaosphaeria arxii CBS 175.79 TaxID=1450172 RepID=A0A6A5XZ91_9PLEO|nr:uncharacterized protein BU24DRAFT_421485 [Aaosphaeria arxii CBS 175.79]KAF2018502.1 hypothetical protein BU24DRAFT_421485 [Aaosphaeria arxii CBS 175.79]
MLGGRLYQLRPCPIFKAIRSSLSHYHQPTAATSAGVQLGPTRHLEHASRRSRDNGETLPVPPLLDPITLDRRSRWEQRKSRPSVDAFTPFQKKLLANPFAHALASPARVCRSTNTLLPDAFLISLHLCPHPETTDPWLLPVSLAASPRASGPPYRFVARKLAVQELYQKQNWRSGVYRRITEKFGGKVGKITWREDMPDLVHSLLQKRLLRQLDKQFKHGGSRLVPCDTPHSESLNHLEEVSCILYFKSLKTHANDIHDRANNIIEACHDHARAYSIISQDYLDPHKATGAKHFAPIWWKGPVIPLLQPRIRFPPLDMPTTLWRGSRVPLYSLQDLLGEDGLRQLLVKSRFKDETCVVAKRSQYSTSMELSLLKLQAYTAIPRP